MAFQEAAIRLQANRVELLQEERDALRARLDAQNATNDAAQEETRQRNEQIQAAVRQVEIQREQEEIAEEQARRETALASVRNQLADADERLVLAAERRANIITTNTDDGSDLRSQLLLENETQLAEARETLRQQSLDRQFEQERELADRLHQAALDDFQRAQELAEQEEELRRENELRRLEGVEEVESLDEARRLAAVQRFEDQKFAIQNRGAGQYFGLLRDLRDLENASALESVNFALGLAQNLTAGLAQTSRAAFEIQKAAAIASATVDGYAAVTGAYKVGASQGGPILGGIYAGIAGAAVSLQIAQIAGTQFGGATSGGASFGGNAGSVPDEIPEAPLVTGDIQEEADTRTSPTIVFQGPIITTDSNELAEMIGPTIGDWLANDVAEGDRTLITPGSRNAQDLAS